MGSAIVSPVARSSSTLRLLVQRTFEFDDDEEAVTVRRDQRSRGGVRRPARQDQRVDHRRDTVDRRQVLVHRRHRLGQLRIAEVDAVQQQGEGRALLRRLLDDVVGDLALRPRHVRLAGGQAVEEALAAHADDREAEAEDGQEHPDGDGAAGVPGDAAAERLQHAGQHRR
jgi:hypothetical protein